MRPIHLQTTVGQAVAEHPDLARIFEHLQIDYCCGGRRTLGDALRERGLEPQTALRVLAASAGAWFTHEADCARLTMPELLDHIECTHHGYLHEVLPRLVGLADKVLVAHGERHPELARLRELVRLFVDEMQDHLAREEAVLFPCLRELAGGRPGFWSGLEAPIQMMESEHDESGRTLREIRDLTDGFQAPADACSSWRSLLQALAGIEFDTHLHVHKENNILFPRVREMMAERV